MSYVIVAQNPQLDFLTVSKKLGERSNCPLPLLLKDNGEFHWEANSFLTDFAGGPQVYNIKPLATTVVKKSYSLNIFCSFLEDNAIEHPEIDDSSIYEFIDLLKERGINDQTILSHGRTALEYIIDLSDKNPEWRLATADKNPIETYKVHYSVLSFKKGGRIISYVMHHAFDGLNHISTEADYIRDHELMMWFDAIKCTTYHPVVDDFLYWRWYTLGTVLDITGSRISEVHKITRSMIKKAFQASQYSDRSPVIRDIPILKGKNKGRTRQVITTTEELQVIMCYINMIEQRFPSIKHDALFVDTNGGSPLKLSYLKNYAKKVIDGSKYSRDLRHLSNHSFRHRFITLTIAKEIRKISKSGSFKEVLKVAATACRKISMHASNDSLANYVHLACEYNNDLDSEVTQQPTQTRLFIRKLNIIVESYRSGQLSDKDTLNSLLAALDDFQPFQFCI
jgi:hypothetical protein